MINMAIQLPVTIETKVIKQNGKQIYYPQVTGLKDHRINEKINDAIYNLMKSLITEQYEDQGTDAFIEMIGTYEIKTNERHVLSLSLSNYAYAEHHAHGLTVMRSLTFDTTSGKIYHLKDLFKQGSDYVNVLSNHVQQQIKARDIPILNDFDKISKNQDFYIADKCLVLYFQLYEITPYYIGFPMFPISVYSLEDIVRESGPLGRMLVN